jgi:hypothetical protein
MNTDLFVNDFAVRCFRDQGDTDYISARMACRAALVGPYLWASEQTIEKYLKCILLLNRIPGRNVGHKLSAALAAIHNSGKVALDLTPQTRRFIEYLDTYGESRYLEISNYAFGQDIVALDRAAWELRRYCTPSDAPSQLKLRDGIVPPRVRLPGGTLERIIDDPKHPAREPLLWQNGFFGRRARRRARVPGWFKASNSPLYLNPQILDEVLKYVYLPNELAKGYRPHKKAGAKT